MSFTLLSLIIILILSFGAAAAAYIGYKSGLIKSSIRLALVVASAFLGAAITVLIVSIFKEQILQTAMAMEIEVIASLGESMEQYGETFAAILCMAFSAFAFIPVFLALYSLSRTVFRIVYKRKSKGFKTNTNESSSARPCAKRKVLRV